MGVAHRLAGYLHRVFDKDEAPALVLRLRYDGAMQWTVADGRLTTTVQGGSGAALDVDLSLHTLATLASYLSSQAGYIVPFAATDPALSGLSALTLIEGSGDQDVSNGDHLRAYTSLLWPYLTALGAELQAAQAAIVEMVEQLAIPTADGEWLDEIGGYYGIRRQGGEIDAYYGPRIIVEVLRPRGNNVAIAQALTEALGRPVTVTDASVRTDSDTPRYNAFNFNDGTAGARYGLGLPRLSAPCQFDVAVDVIDFEGDLTDLSRRALDLLERFRDAGTYLRRLYRAGSCGFYYDGRTRYDGLSCYGDPRQDPHNLAPPPALSGVGSWPIETGLTPFTVG